MLKLLRFATYLPGNFIWPLLVIGTVTFVVGWPFLSAQIEELANWISDPISYESVKPVVRHLVIAIGTVLALIAGGLVSYNLAVVCQHLLRPLFRLAERPRPLRWLRRRSSARASKAQPKSSPAPPVEGPGAEQQLTATLKGFDRIGIVCAGGGAKGVYQAAALKAIYEFLSSHDALDRVKTVAGSSIGAWNALFWVADEVRPQGDETVGSLEAWWRGVDLGEIIDFDFYVPWWRSHILRNEPWRQWFESLFLETEETRNRLADRIDGDDVNFYITQTNVASGRREYYTNNRALQSLQGREGRPQERSDRYHLVSEPEGLKKAIFASMDIPPLFDYVESDGHLYEDGGVADNLPVYFGTRLDKCDLLFILPLNATTEALPSQRSILSRLHRVLDARQGIIERNAMKLTYLYNQAADLMGSGQDYQKNASELLAGARDECAEVRRIVRSLGDDADASAQAVAQEAEEALERARRLDDKLADRNLRAATHNAGLQSIVDEIREAKDAVQRCREQLTNPARKGRKAGAPANQKAEAEQPSYRHRRTTVFAICPAPPLDVGTMGFWKGEDVIGKAFDVMYRTTRAELRKFFASPRRDVRVALVNRSGLVSYDDDF